MKKMMLLASVVALAALMLAAAPAFADDNHHGRDFCDRHDCVDNNNDDNGVDFNNRTLNRIGGDRNIINGPDFGDVDVNSDSSIDVSPAMTVNGGGTIDQAAAASSTWVWTPVGWRLM
jgi:hypothetical protein